MQGHEALMRKAVEVAGRNPSAPFASILFDTEEDRVVIEGINRSSQNPILHGEIDALMRYAENGLDRWSRLRLYTTAEPCCMCQAAIIWAGIPEVIFGTSIERLASSGWNQFQLKATEVAETAPFAQCKIVGGVLEDVCDRLFEAARK